MKKVFLLIIGISLSITVYCQSDSIIELPIEMKDGYGPFISSRRSAGINIENEKNPWLKTYIYASGIPDDWTEVKQGSFETDISQTIYYNYHAGNITPEFYQQLQKSWRWTPDTLALSKEKIKTQIAFIYGKDASGELKIMLDTNNNLDYSDEEAFTPWINSDPKLDMDSFIKLYENSPKKRVEYERLSNNKIIRETAPLSFSLEKSRNMLMCNIAKHAVAQLDGDEIALSFDNFHSLNSNSINLILMNDSLRNGKKANQGDVVAIDEFLVVNDKIYKNKGVDKNRNILKLEIVNLPKNEIESTQVGYKAIPFESKLFDSEETISLNDYQGKYLLIDFWAFWCGPCLKEFPALKSFYESLDKSKIEFLGIAGNSKAEPMREIIVKHDLPWPQILSDDTNQIIQKYKIGTYPSTLLINSQGVIVAKNLRGKELEDKIKEVLK